MKEIQSFLGFTEYYRKFIKNFFSIARPLTKLTQKRPYSTGHLNALKVLNN